MQNPHLTEMITRAKKALAFCYVPASSFAVSACILAENDQYFVGCNFENASFPLSICAETSAIANMISAGCRQIREILIMNDQSQLCPPCGGCRQQILEFSTPDTVIYLYGNGELKKTLTIKELLPTPFQF